MRMKKRCKEREYGWKGVEQKLLEKLLKENKKIMATLQEMKDAIAEIATTVKADVAQDVKVVEAINALLAALAAAGNTDFQAEVDALKAASAELAGDNAAVQAAIDAAVPPTTPPANT